jgi:hypothetical protein
MEVSDLVITNPKVDTLPVHLSRGDMFVAQEIEAEQEGWVRNFISKNWPELLN